ncbi:glycosyltransferase family 4 protein [Paenibacillus sp. CMAA1364]
MKLLQALFFPPEQPGGVSSMIPYMQERFTSSEWDMDMFWLPKRLRDKGREEVVFDTFDWTIYKDNIIVSKYIQTYRDYLWWAQMRIRTPYELIHAHHPISGLAMKKLFPEIPLIQTIHSSYERELILNGTIQEDGPEHQFLTSLYRELESKSDRMMTVSQSFATYLSSYVNHPEVIQVIPNGFDERRFAPVPHNNEIIQLVTVCRLVPAKGLDILIRSCAELKIRGYDYVLHIIGDGPYRKELEELARELNVYNETIFYGYTLHPEVFIPFFDIFVLPSRAESFGSVFAEAALSGLALIGTNVGGISEQIVDGVNGLLVPVEDYIALTDALELVISQPNYRNELARSAWEKAKTDYALSHVVNILKKIYLQYDHRKE